MDGFLPAGGVGLWGRPGGSLRLPDLALPSPDSALPVAAPILLRCMGLAPLGGGPAAAVLLPGLSASLRGLAPLPGGSGGEGHILFEYIPDSTFI